MAIEIVEINAPPEIIAAFQQGRREGSWLVAVCPRCGKGPRDRKLRAGIYRGAPWWNCMRCRCKSDYYREKRTEAMRFEYDRNKADAEEKRMREAALRIWEFTSTIKPGDPVDRYLREQRKLKPFGDAWPVDLRYGQIEYYFRDGHRPRRYDAMICAVRSVSGGFMGIHRTYLLPDGRRADGKSVPDEWRVREAKKTLGPIIGGSVRLFTDPEPTKLGVAEGIETSLAFEIYLEMPVASAVSAAGMEALVLPKSVRYLFIGPDIGDEGHNGHGKHKGLYAAIDLRDRALREADADGRELTVKLCPPPLSGRADWNDWVIKNA